MDHKEYEEIMSDLVIRCRELLFIYLYWQVWGVKYNGNGSKIVSVGDDQEIHIYDCPI